MNRPERTWTHSGWYVGYVEKGRDLWFFAMNLDIKTKDQARFYCIRFHCAGRFPADPVENRNSAVSFF